MKTIVDPIDSPFMRLALEQAELALSKGEVPVGAVVVSDGKVIGVGHNATIGSHDPSAHAEVVALRNAGLNHGNYRLDQCDLYVTLEPCVMCCGAILHARIRRLVFGASDPKTGAAGSVLNVFGHTELNHQTVATGGVLAPECAQLLQQFFRQRRQVQQDARRMAFALREDALRTPDTRFESLGQIPWDSHYGNDLPMLQGLRLHYLDAGPRNAPHALLLVHASPAWGYAFYRAIPLLVEAGYRVVVPDLIGFGRSDKPKQESHHTKHFHQQVLTELMERLCLQHVVLATQITEQGSAIDAPEHLPGIERALYVRCTGAGEEEGAWLDAPFPDKGHRAGIRAFQKLVAAQPSLKALIGAEFVSPRLSLDEQFARFALHSVREIEANARVNPRL